MACCHLGSSVYGFELFLCVCVSQDGVLPSGLVVDYSTPGMKELDALGVDIDTLQRF